MISKANHEIPVRIYQKEKQFAVAAPMPGLEPEDITVTIEGKRVTIDGKERGPRHGRGSSGRAPTACRRGDASSMSRAGAGPTGLRSL